MDPIHARIEDPCKPGTHGGIQASVIFLVQERALGLCCCSSNHV